MMQKHIVYVSNSLTFQDQMKAIQLRTVSNIFYSMRTMYSNSVATWVPPGILYTTCLVFMGTAPNFP